MLGTLKQTTGKQKTARFSIKTAHDFAQLNKLNKPLKAGPTQYPEH